jgi:hypothetical protein
MAVCTASSQPGGGQPWRHLEKGGLDLWKNPKPGSILRDERQCNVRGKYDRRLGSRLQGSRERNAAQEGVGSWCADGSGARLRSPSSGLVRNPFRPPFSSALRARDDQRDATCREHMPASDDTSWAPAKWGGSSAGVGGHLRRRSPH